MAITRDPDTDDDGTGLVGTIRNAAWKTQLYDRIDAAIDGADATTRAVNKGGTGATSFTDGGVLVGNGTGAIQATAVGNASQVLTSQGSGSDPIFKKPGTTVSTEVSSATPTINTDNVDAHSITALATAITSMTTNLSGTPTNFQKLIIRIKDNGTARAITWGASFQSGTATLPTTTVLSKTLTVGFFYNTVSAKWECMAAGSEP